ncbi:hypothetical protein ACFQ2B_02685 [Streptomyces stramineus]
MAACDTDLARCQREAADATGALAALVAEEAGIRRDLGAAPLPVDADGLARTLEELLVERQRAVAEAARSADALGAVQRGRTALTDALTLAQGRLAKATDAAKKAQEDADQVAAWVGAVRARSAGKASPGTDPKRGGAAQKTEDAAGTSDATAQKTEGPAQKTEGPAQKDESPAQKPESPAQKAGTAAQSSDGAAQRPDGAAPPPADGSLDGARGRLDALFGAALFKLFRIRAVEAAAHGRGHRPPRPRPPGAPETTRRPGRPRRRPPRRTGRLRRRARRTAGGRGRRVHPARRGTKPPGRRGPRARPDLRPEGTAQAPAQERPGRGAQGGGGVRRRTGSARGRGGT